MWARPRDLDPTKVHLIKPSIHQGDEQAGRMDPDKTVLECIRHENFDKEPVNIVAFVPEQKQGGGGFFSRCE
jgi:hypothetical protein